MRIACTMVMGCVFFLSACSPPKPENLQLTVHQTKANDPDDIFPEPISPNALAVEFKNDAIAARAKYIDVKPPKNSKYDCRPILIVRGECKTMGFDHRIKTDTGIDVVLRAAVIQGTGNLVEGQGRVMDFTGKEILILAGRVILSESVAN
jgi:hypothetical protein